MKFVRFELGNKLRFIIIVTFYFSVCIGRFINRNLITENIQKIIVRGAAAMQ